jgi:signal transduction histidine kinase
MIRLSLATRLTLIVLVALLGAWLAALTTYYRSHEWDLGDIRPSPGQLAALTRLIEQTPNGQRQLILDAIDKTSNLSTRIGSNPEIADIIGHPVRERLRADYAAALAPRQFSMASTKQRRFLWPAILGARRFEFRIALKTGDQLVVDAVETLPSTRLGLPVGFGAGLLGTLVALVALVLLNREMRPLSRLATAVDRIDPTSAPAPLPPLRTHAPEIEAVVLAFNRLQQRLKTLLNARMALIGGISHDVRTFATRLRLRVDQIPEESERAKAISDISDMIRLLDDAVLASRAGAGELGEELIELDKLVSREIEDRQDAGSFITLHIDFGARGTSVLGDRLALRRIIANLLDNALHYGQVAHVVLRSEGTTLILSVEDEGPGIPLDQREALLEPFVRLETSRSRSTGGAGLGLAIVRNLVEAHRGTIAIEDGERHGARFIIQLPLFVSS